MLVVTREYFNDLGELIRTDEILMEPTSNSIAKPFTEQTYRRRLNTTLVIGPVSRTVDSIQVTGNFTDYEASSGDILYVEWSSPTALCDMSDLPGLTDTV